MNSTSAAERGGNVGLVEDESVFVGAPGAPGCTTTGFVPVVCYEQAGDATKIAARTTRARTRQREVTRREGLNLRSQR
jgi:hypothetical protein